MERRARPYIKPGQSLTEYSLMALLLGVAVVGGLSLFGSSLSQLFGQVNNTTTTSQGTLSLLQANGAISQPGVPSQVSDATAVSQSGLALPSGQDAIEFRNISSGGTNATSVDGTQDFGPVYSNLDLLKQLRQVLADSNNPDLQSWAKVLTVRIEWLIASQGYTSGMSDFQKLLKGSNYTKASAYGDIIGYQQELQDIIGGASKAHGVPSKPGNVDPAVWGKITNIVSQISQNATAYVQSSDGGTSHDPQLTAWHGVYNSMVSPSTTTSTINTIIRNGSVNAYQEVKNTVDRKLELEKTVDVKAQASR